MPTVLGTPLAFAPSALHSLSSVACHITLPRRLGLQDLIFVGLWGFHPGLLRDLLLSPVWVGLDVISDVLLASSVWTTMSFPIASSEGAVLVEFQILILLRKSATLSFAVFSCETSASRSITSSEL